MKDNTQKMMQQEVQGNWILADITKVPGYAALVYLTLFYLRKI